jgi:serine/threonine protein kinase/tetratricopeptide (TPR) repeat protein
MSGAPHADTSAPAPAIPDHELIRRIGDGAYGEVWLARNVLGELRAVKIIHRSRFSDPRPFEREFEGIQRFEPISRSHPSQLAILHVGKNEAPGCFYYVMELADPFVVPALAGSGSSRVSTDRLKAGLQTYSPHTLRHDLEQHGRLPIPDCIQIGLSLTTALAHLHQHGLVHRDIKPSNVIFVNGVPKLGDIGLVTEAGDTQSIVGTEGYLPPEGPGTPQGDIFSLGKVLYEISTGMDRRKFPALPDDLANLTERRALLEFNEILLKACAHDARERYASAEAMRVDLERLRRGKSVRWGRTFESSIRWTKRSLPFAAALSVVWFLVSRFHDSMGQRSNASATARVFVLPFRNDGTNQVDELLRSRVADAFIDGLELIDGVKVGPRKSGWARLDEDAARQKAVKELGARYVVSGTLKANTNEMVLVVSLSDGAGLVAGRTQTFRAAPPSQVAVERQAIDWTVQQLGLKPEQDWTTRLNQVLADNQRALELVKAAPWEVEYSKTGLSKCETAFTQAIILDRKFAQAQIYLAAVVGRLCDRQSEPRKIMARMDGAMKEVLRLDDTLGVAHQGLGYVTAFFRWRWAEGEAHFKRAIELDSADYWAHWNYAKYLRIVGRLEEAQAETDRAHELSGRRFYSILAEQLYATGRFAEAARLPDPVKPGGAGCFYDGDLLAAAGRFAESIAAFERTRAWDDSPEWISRLGFVHARAGNREKAEEALRELKSMARTHPYVSPYFLAVAHLALGNTNECFAALDQAVTDRSRFIAGWGLYGLATDVVWDDIRGDTRYAALLDRAGLTPAARKLALQRKLPGLPPRDPQPILQGETAR